MSFDFENPYLNPELDNIFLGFYEIEGVRKIAELSRQVRSLLNFKKNIIQYRFRSSSNKSLKLRDDKFHEHKKQFESLALCFIRLLNKIKGNCNRTLEEEIQLLFYQVRVRKNPISLSVLKELKDLTYQLSTKIHYFSEQTIYNHPYFLKLLIQVAKEICKTRKNMNQAFSDFYDELSVNYQNLEEEITSLVPEIVSKQEKRKIKQLSEELIS